MNCPVATTPRRPLSCVLALLLIPSGPSPAADGDGSPGGDFNRVIRPILAEHCLACHGPDETRLEADLRLDLREEATRDRDGYAAIVPGDPDASELILRVEEPVATLRMPPPESGDPLTPDEVEALRGWIARGAPYAGHWAFSPPERPPVPEVDPGRDRVRNPIDAFVLGRLRQEGLGFSPPAPPETLCRRVSLDLIGLPPSPRELSDFVAADLRDRRAAVDGLVDRLLASPHFGEKWARHWLDLARYADSDGYEKDLPRQQWAYRDWVIRAINRDLPYDRFIVEQVAGDLLPDATQDQIVATGYLRNGMVNQEGAILAEEFRKEGLFDRMDAIGKGILGLSFQCAQCHTHKYDPLTHEEYYRLFAFLNNDYEATSRVYSPDQLARIEEVRAGVASAEERLKRDHPDWPDRLASWAQQQRSIAEQWHVLNPINPDWIGGLAHPEAMPDGSVLTLGFRPTTGELVVEARTDRKALTGLRLEALTHGDLPFGGPGRNDRGTFAVSELEVEIAPAEAEAPEWKKLALVDATSAHPTPERPIEPSFRKGDDDKRAVGPAAFLIDGKEETAWSPDLGPGRRNIGSELVARFAEPVGFPSGTRLRFTLKYRHGGADVHGSQNNFLGRFRLAVTDAPDPEAAPLPPEARMALLEPDDRRSPGRQALIFAAWRRTMPDAMRVNAEIDRLWDRYPEEPMTTVLHLARRLPEHARQTFRLDRGAWDRPVEEVSPGIPAFLHPIPGDATPDRLDFARWLADRESPTTARVAVNRAWQAIFGVGLVETAEEFGTRGDPPSHPELLDWLAVEFMDNGWSLKRLVRTIVTSSTYQQSSRVTPELLERDPKNRLLARGPRFRAEAEVLRDIALSISGLLNPEVGGPSVFPPVPESLFAQSYIEVDFWDTAEGPDRYRRSLYVFRRRSQPDPVLSSFDAPNGDFACPRRDRSNTPLAALAAMNEPVFAEAARALALRVLREGGATDADRTDFAFRLGTGRMPEDAERDAILGLLASRRAKLADGWLSAREISTGDPASLPDLPDGATPQDAAAWTIVARVLLNLDETLSKN